MNVGMHFNTLLTMTASGILVSMLFETYKLLFRPSALSGKIIVDTLFMLTQSCLVYYLLFITNGGIIRFYIFLAILLGFSIYVVMFQSLYRRILEIIIETIKQITYLIIRTIDTLIIAPIKWLISLFVTVVTYTLYLLFKIVLFLLRVIFYPIKLVIKLLEKLLPEKVLKNVTKTLEICSTILYKFKSRVKEIVTKRR